MIGKNADHNQVLVNENDQSQNSPRKPGWDHNDPGYISVHGDISKNLGHYGTIQVFWDCSIDDHFYLLTPD